MRYKDLLSKIIDTDGIPLREVARELGLPPGSIHNYLYQSTEPRRDALEKMSAYFEEPVSQLLSEDDDLTARILTLVRRMDQDQKQLLLDDITNRMGHIWAISPLDKKTKG
jgi:transcriptional regulator with XRE-family HTH domain